MVRDQRKLVVGTGNPGKVREIAAALAGTGITPASIATLVDRFDPVEDGPTFQANARIKAEAAHAATGLPVMADDSGLCVVGLGGAPGVHSARYAGTGKSDGQRVEFLLSQMASLTGSDRRAWFACVICALVPRTWLTPKGQAVAVPTSNPALVEVMATGRLDGHIGLAPCGDGGFGYDPVFFPDHDPKRSLAQVSMAEKNVISHRGRALMQLAKLIGE